MKVKEKTPTFWIAPFLTKKWVQSPNWFWAFAVCSAICILTYLLNLIVSEVQPYNTWGLVYGTLATGLVICVALYGVRRRIIKFTKKYRAGRSQTWVQFHVYAGTLFLLLVFMHSGFRVPTGALTWWLWFLSLWVTLSGFLGVILQKWIPKILTSGLSIEVHYDRIPDLIHEIKERAEKLIKTCDDPIRDFYRKNLAIFLAGPQARLIYYIDITGGIQSQTKKFNYLNRFLPVEEKEKLHELELMYKTKLEIDAHYTLQKALRWWLYLHLPISIAVFVLVGLHLFTVLYY